MNFPTSSTPAQITPEDLKLVEQENIFLLETEMKPYSMESEQDIAEAARDIRERNEVFILQNTSNIA